MKIAVAGTGYVGLSLATLLSQNNEVIALDVIPEKVEMINNRISPIKDEYIESGELDWNKMADRLLKLGEGETFSLAIQMLPYMLPKDNRTWLMQVIDDTVDLEPFRLAL